MPATTPDGWPYILPTDKPLEYPAQNQQLANLLEARWDTYQDAGLIIPAAGWADAGGSLTGLWVTRYAGMVTVEAAFSRTGAGLSCAVGASKLIGTIPAGFLPGHDVGGVLDNSLNIPGVAAVEASTGSIYFRLHAAGTIPTGGRCQAYLTYRQAD